MRICCGKQRLSVLNLYIESQADNRKEINENNMLDLASAHIQLSAAIGSVSTGKVNRVSAAQKQVKTVVYRKLEVITAMMTISHSQNWLRSDSVSDVPLRELRQT